MTRSGRLLWAALSVAGTVVSAPALAKGPDRKACVTAADEGQKLRDDGALTLAREKFIACASSACPAVIVKDCSEWLSDVDRDLPSVTFRARDERDKDVIDVRVLIDGRLVSEAIDARAFPLDPGTHTFRFERADGEAVEEIIVIRPAERNRLIELSFSPPGSAGTASLDATSSGFRVPALAWGGLGLAVAGGAMTAVFALQARDHEERLRGSCAPSCPTSERDAIDAKLLFANIGLGIAAVGVGVAAISTILANTGGSSDVGRASVVVAPHHGGAAIGLTGAF